MSKIIAPPFAPIEGFSSDVVDFEQRSNPPTAVTYDTQDLQWKLVGNLFVFRLELRTDALTVGTGTVGIGPFPYANGSQVSGGDVYAQSWAADGSVFGDKHPRFWQMSVAATDIWLQTLAKATVKADATFMQTSANKNRLIIDGQYFID